MNKKRVKCSSEYKNKKENYMDQEIGYQLFLSFSVSMGK
jgi:hypothetical protein